MSWRGRGNGLTGPELMINMKEFPRRVWSPRFFFLCGANHDEAKFFFGFDF